MVKFTICLADLLIGINALCESTMHFCHDYVTCSGVREPDIHICLEKIDIVSECEKAEQSLLYEGKRLHRFSEEELEKSALYRKIGNELPKFGGFVFHGSAVAVNGEGYIFSGSSGVGKSTHAGIWKEVLGERLLYVNDDKPIIILKDGIPYVFGSPWSGKHHKSMNIGVPIRGIAFLKQSNENKIKRINTAEAFPLLLQQSYRPQSREAFIMTLSALDNLSLMTSMYLLECNMKKSAAYLAFEEMSGNKIEGVFS